jgi:hypothetical protein
LLHGYLTMVKYSKLQKMYNDELCYSIENIHKAYLSHKVEVDLNNTSWLHLKAKFTTSETTSDGEGKDQTHGFLRGEEE